jgi:hypothetical protein
MNQRCAIFPCGKANNIINVTNNVDNVINV